MSGLSAIAATIFHPYMVRYYQFDAYRRNLMFIKSRSKTIISFLIVGCLGIFCIGVTAAEIEVIKESGPNPWTHLNVNDDPDCFQFVIVTDNAGGIRPGVFADAVKKVNLLQPEFVMCVGDLIQGYSTDLEKLAAQWKVFTAQAEQFEMPFFYLPGNHDITNKVMEADWKRRFGRSYYHFVYRNVLFLCINTEDPPDTQMSDAQVEYFAKALEDNKDVRWTLAFMHKPMWNYAQDKSRKNWERFESLMAGRAYTMYAGHTHNYAYEVRNKRNYYILATTGGASRLRGPIYGEFDHFVWITMTKDGPRMANLMLDGVYPHDIRTQETSRLVRNLSYGRWISYPPLLIDDDKFSSFTMRVSLENPIDRPMKVSGVFKPNRYIRSDTEKIERVLLPKEKVSFDIRLFTDIPVALDNLDPMELALSVQCRLKDGEPMKLDITQIFAIDKKYPCPRSKGVVQVDGNLDEWGELPLECKEPAIPKQDQEHWMGVGDGSYRFATCYDDDFLYIAVDTQDDTLFAPQKGSSLDGDRIILRLDARPDPWRSKGRGEYARRNRDYLYIKMAPGDSPTSPNVAEQANLPKGTRLACAKKSKGLIFEIAIPAKYLSNKQKADWKAFRFNIDLVDHDDSESVTYIWWKPQWGAVDNIRGSGTFIRN
jgi:Calcineurin-like phosphoesterase